MLLLPPLSCSPAEREKNAKPLQDMLLAEPELSQLGRQEICSILLHCALYLLILLFINLLLKILQDNKKSLSELEMRR